MYHETLQHTTKLESDVSFQELNELTRKIDIYGKETVKSKQAGGKKVGASYNEMTLYQLKQQQQRKAIKIQKSFAQNLQEILEQQKSATIGQMNKLISQADKTNGPI